MITVYCCPHCFASVSDTTSCIVQYCPSCTAHFSKFDALILQQTLSDSEFIEYKPSPFPASDRDVSFDDIPF
jgi:hypothetical protein